MMGQSEEKNVALFKLDPPPESDCIRVMKMKNLLALVGALIIGAGCVSTVNERSTVGVPFVKDRFEGRYERSVDQVLQAAKEVVMANGALTQEGTVYYDQNTSIKTVEGKVNQRNVWIRIQSLDPKVTSLTVQTRTKGGGSDLGLAHDIEKQIALKLAAVR
jgi:hypothetical protein